MKMLQGPYPAFEKYYSLEETIDLYNEIWYESSSSDAWMEKEAERFASKEKTHCFGRLIE